MTLLTILGGLVSLPLCLYLPGQLLAFAVFGRRPPLQGLELHLMRVVVSVLLAGWIGFVLAELGLWSLPAVILGALAVSLPATLFRWRRARPLGPPVGTRLGIVAPIARTRPVLAFSTLSRTDWALLLVAVVFAGLVAHPFEVVRGGLDAGVYALTGLSIAHTGSIVIHDPVVAEIGRRAEAGDLDAQNVMSQFLGVQDPVRYIATRLRASGFFISAGDWSRGRVVPQFFHLWPVWIATGTAIGGPVGGLLATGACALLGILLLGMLGRRVAHPVAGIGAAAFLALNSVEVWFGRMPVSEALAQALTLAGLWAYSHFADAPSGITGVWWGALVGTAFGELALARIDFFWAVGPVILLLLYTAVSHRWRAGHTALLVALAALLVHAALHVVFIARAYFFDTAYAPLGQISALVERLALPFMTTRMRERLATREASPLLHAWRLPYELALVLGSIALLVLLWRYPRPLKAAEMWVVRHRSVLLGALALGLGVLACYAYVVRPRIIDAQLLRMPLSGSSRARLQGYIGAPITVPSGLRVTVARDQANFVRFGWYLSPLGVLLGVAGGVLLIRRGPDRRSWLFMLIAGAYTLFYLRTLYGTSEATYIYILRRYVPMVYPAWSFLMAYALWRLGRRPHADAWRRLAAAVLALCLLLFFVATGRNVYAHVEYGGAIEQFRALAEAVKPDDIILVRGGGRDVSDVAVGPLTYLFQRNALTFKGAQPMKYAGSLADQVRRWTSEGRGVYALIGSSGGDWRLPGWETIPRLDWTWSFREFQQLQDQKPYAAGPGSLSFRLYQLVPAAGATARSAAVTPADPIAEVAGFYGAERDSSGLYAWTMKDAVLRLSPARHVASSGAALHLRLAAGPRPAALGTVRVCFAIAPEMIPYPTGGRDALAWTSLGCGIVARASTDLRLPLPQLSADQPYLLRLSTEPWTPRDTPPDRGEPASSDTRSLGIRWLEASLIAP